MRKVPVPQGSPFGGLLTQAAVLKVSANGTNTSPVVRGAWVMERLIGQPPPPPPLSVPAVEPDIRGAKTIRDLLALHTKEKSCASCHAKSCGGLTKQWQDSAHAKAGVNCMDCHQAASEATRGSSGKIPSGVVKKGDTLVVLASDKSSKV